jgi:hypothetical protein
VTTDNVDVLCIGATGQSGSTLFSRMLGQLPGLVAVGETGRVWDKGLIENVECGCSAPFRSCEFWTRVGDAAFGGWGAVDAQEATRLRDALTLKGRMPHPFALPLIRRPGLWRSYDEQHRRYAELMERLLHGIHDVTDGAVIVDSMKQPAHVYMLSGMPSIDLKVVHLVRDSRGVAYSKTRWVARQGAIEGAYRVRRHPPKSGEKWIWMNLSFDLLARLGVPTATVRYETFVRTPAPELERVATLLNLHLDDSALGFIHDGEVELEPAHLAAGSRGRLESGRTSLRLDEEWRTKLPAAHRRVVSAMTWPLLRRYGYVGPHGVYAAERSAS